MEKKFANESSPVVEPSKVKITKKDSNDYRKFEEFFKDIKKPDKEKRENR